MEMPCAQDLQICLLQAHLFVCRYGLQQSHVGRARLYAKMDFQPSIDPTRISNSYNPIFT